LLFAAVLRIQVTKSNESPEGQGTAQRCQRKYFGAIRGVWRTKLAMEIVCGKEIADQFQDIDRPDAMTARKMERPGLRRRLEAL